MNKEALITDNWNTYLDFFQEDLMDIYFTEEYVKLYEDQDSKAECFIYQKGERIFLFPYLKKRINIIDGDWFDFETAYGYGGPLCNVQDHSFIEDAWAEFKLFSTENRVVAGFVRFHPLLNNHRFVDGDHNVMFDRKTVFVDLTLTEKQLWEEQIHPKHRNVIRKAEEAGLVYKVDEEFVYLDAFVSIYHDTMKRLNTEEFYLFSDRYFTDIKKTLSKNAFLGLVFLDGRAISSSIFLHYGKFGHYHLSGSLDEYLHCYPNNFLLFNTILYMKEKGLKCFHLGGGTDGSSGNGLYKFKRRFSKQETDFYIGKIIFDKNKYDKICGIWENENPDKKEKYGNILLKHRY